MAAFGTNIGGSAAATGSPGPNPNNDVEVTQPPTDGISSIKFSPVANHVIATSWDNQVRCWEISPNGQSAPKASTAHEQPVLCADWSPDGSTVFSGGCDKQVKMWSLASNQAQQVAKHEAPICFVFLVKELSNMLVTGSWDRTIKYWDLRQPNPVHSQQVPDRVYAMDIRYPLMVVGTAQRRIQVYNLNSPQQVYKELESPLKYQTRCISCFPDTSGYLIGSIEGRIAVHHVEDAQQAKNFTFKCHRDGNDIYPVNSISFHPTYGTFATTGGDGGLNFWDKDSKQRLKAMQKVNQPIPCGCFNKDGSIYAYAVSYDWSRGYAEYNPQTSKNYILLHSPQESEVVKRAASTRPAGRR